MEEYWITVGYRDQWAQEVAACAGEEAELEDQIARIGAALHKLQGYGEHMHSIAAALAMIPADCASWQGARSEESFQRCSQGDLYDAYRRLQDALERIIRSMEEALRERKERLAAVRERRIAADRQLRAWNERVAAW